MSLVALVIFYRYVRYGPLAKCVKLRVVHAPGMPETFSPLQRVNDLDMHHGTCVTHVPLCMPGWLTSGFLWSRWRGKRFRHSRRMPQFYVSGMRPIMAMFYPATMVTQASIFFHFDSTLRCMALRHNDVRVGWTRDLIIGNILGLWFIEPFHLVLSDEVYDVCKNSCRII